MTHYLSMPKLVRRRLADDRLILLSIFVSVTLATTLVAGAPAYIRALERQSFSTTIDTLVRPFSNINAFAFYIPLKQDSLEATDQALQDAIDMWIARIYERRERYLLVSAYLAGLPSNPLPESLGPDTRASRAYFRHLTNLDSHVRFVDGRMATGVVQDTPAGPEIEAVIGTTAARMFGLSVDDLITVVPAIGHPTPLNARIVGIMTATDPTEDYWQLGPGLFLDPPPPEEVPEGVQPDYDPGQPPVPLFTTMDALTDGVGTAYPGTLASSIWFIFTDTEGLKGWTLEEVRQHLEDFERDIAKAMPGSDIGTGIDEVLAGFATRTFFLKLPLLLLLTVMVATVLFYLSMTVSYLVQKREGDLALLKTRGLGALQLLRLYGLEAAVLTVLAVVIAPFLALAAVALAGRLPYFSQSTAGHNLPIQFTPQPFLAALGAGALCLAILLVPALVGARRGLAVHKLSSSRPPSVPFFQRYYLDVALLVLGGLVFWELHARGQFVSGGLFKQVQVNETLLLAPVIFLFVVALVFVRLFPLLVRFVSGESPALAHLFTAATLLAIVPIAAFQHFDDGGLSQAAAPTALLLAVGLLYWAATQLRRFRARIAAIALQAAAVAAFIYFYRPSSDDLMFLPAVGLVAIVPVQIAFMALRTAARTAPVWLSMGLWRMARNPLQYTWLVMLLLLATGLAILSTTVGGTLDQSQIDRIHYDVAADVRVSGVHPATAGSSAQLRAQFQRIPGVTDVAIGLRQIAAVGPVRPELLALESREFRYITWYRDDFSTRPLSSVLSALRLSSQDEPIMIPEGANSLAMWINPGEAYPGVSLRAVVEDARGFARVLSFGELGEPGWRPVRVPIPPGIPQPLRLLSVQIFELGGGAVGTPGTIRFDDILATSGPRDTVHFLEDFEEQMRWVAVPTAAFSTDRIRFAAGDTVRGARSGSFTFGRDMEHGIRGFYQSPTGSAIPAVASASFLDATGLRIGQTFISSLGFGLLPLVVRDVVDYFPTLSPDGDGFLLVELDNLVRHMKIVTPQVSVVANEVFLSEAPTAGRSVMEMATVMTRPFATVKDLDAQLEATGSDPLTSAGWRAMMGLALVLVLLAAGIGYSTYLLSIAGRGRSELGFLRSIGFSRIQVVLLLGFEHLAVAAVGLGLGTWVGMTVSRLMVSSVTVTERGEQILPPFVLTTEWSLLAPVYIGITTLFMVAVYALSRAVSRLDLRTVARVEGP